VPRERDLDRLLEGDRLVRNGVFRAVDDHRDRLFGLVRFARAAAVRLADALPQSEQVVVPVAVCYSACNFDPLSRGIGVQN
jgi:hypothetical protein